MNTISMIPELLFFTYQKCVEADGSNLFVERSPSIFQEKFQRYGIFEFLHQDIGRGKDFEGTGESYWHIPRRKVMLESEEIFGLVAKIKLSVHHIAEHSDFFRKG